MVASAREATHRRVPLQTLQCVPQPTGVSYATFIKRIRVRYLELWLGLVSVLGLSVQLRVRVRLRVMVRVGEA